MANPAESLRYVTTARVSPDLLKALVILSNTTVRRSANQKKGHISRGDKQAYCLHVF